MSKKILITGAGGFIGGYLVAEALKRGFETWAAVRSTTSREFLTDERIHFIELDFSDYDKLEAQLRQAVAENGAWHYVVHNLGATKAANYQTFRNVNYGYLRALVDALAEIGAVPERFLLMSSLSVMGMGDEKHYTPFRATAAPHPNTRYGMSKLQAETYLQMRPDFPSVIFRCTGVYGPHERDYYLMIKSISKGFDFSVGFKKQMLTFLYVEDLARGVMDALEKAQPHKVYIMSGDGSYTQKQFRKIVARELGKKFVLPIVCPIWLLWLVCRIGSMYSKLTLNTVTLNADKFKILKQRNWLCDTSEAKADFGFEPRFDLENGIHKAVEWYKQAGWL